MTQGTPSQYQLDIFDFIRNETGSAIIDAVAGSGKTTTICNAAKLLSPGGTYYFLAFNKNIADELKTRLPYFVQASTFHALCFSAYKKKFPKVFKPTPQKTKLICEENELIPQRSFWKVYPYVEKLVGYAKGTAVPRGLLEQQLPQLIDHHEMDEPPDNAIAIAKKVLELSFQDTGRVDFDDMLWMVYHLDIPFVPLADFVFVDEAQDLSGIQHELLKRMLKTGKPPTGNYDAGSGQPYWTGQGRLIAVGDKHQAIYGFRGAHTNGMDELKKQFSAKELPLSISYRCSQAVVKEAQRILSSPTAAQQWKTEGHGQHRHSELLRTPIDPDQDIDPWMGDDIPY